jgi:phospholipase C
MRRSLTAVLCLIAVGACATTQAAHVPATTPVAAPTSAPTASPPASPTPSARHVFLIVMENRSYDQALAGGYTATLANRYAVATDYHGVSHPSLPNYLAMTSGSTWGVADDGWHPLPKGGLGSQLAAGGISWRAYMEGMSRTCMSSPYPYALKHDPFAYYGASCPKEVVPFTSFAADMAGGDVPDFVWITPGLCHDGHDCSTGVADQWLAQVVPQIEATDAWKSDGLLVITWDEGEDSANHILTLFIQPGGTHETSSHAYDHYSLLATIEDRFGLARLGQAKNATAMSDLLSGS